jgi:hypothetical protein
MAKHDLPRPWLLAALADVPVAMLAQQEPGEADAEQREKVLPRAEARRPRLSARDRADHWPDDWLGEDCWRGAVQWHDLEAERAN